ncbi:MAG: hypothetical protein WC373_15920 [Smithella sp.]|jgi:hypothetical protein
MRTLKQYPIDLCDRQTCLKGVLKIKRQFLYITIRDVKKPGSTLHGKPAWYVQYVIGKQAKRINEIVKELYV